MVKNMLALLWVTLALNFGAFVSCSGAVDIVIEKGKSVSFDYTLTVDSKVVDSSKERGPLKYVHGEGGIIPGLEKRLEGLHVGDEKTVIVAPEDGYGKSRPDAFREVSRSALPSNQVPQVGMVLQMQSPDGKVFFGRVSEVKSDVIVVDFNHPLAGKTLKFKVKIVSIQ